MSIPCIGITGGIGSGKSLVSKVLSDLSYPVYDADSRAKFIMVSDEEIRQAITAIFGSEAYFPDGNLNRSHLSARAFKEPAVLEQLNRVVHPATGKDFNQWKSDQEQSSPAPRLLFKEAAILFESGAWKGVDAVLTVYAPKAVRIQRVMQRDQTDREAVLARIGRQWPETKKASLADFVIYNDGNHLLLPQVAAALRHFREM